jgi:hypothetical protein
MSPGPLWQTQGMAQIPGDHNSDPTLELPSLKLPGLVRRRRRRTQDVPVQEPGAGPVDVPVQEPETGPVDVPVQEPEPGPSRPRMRRQPTLPGWAAAAITGVVVGALGAAATYGALAGCEAVRGVSSCGGAPGFFVLVAILALMILLGGALLKGFAVADAGSTSFLAVGIVAVTAMLVLLEVIFSPWMFAVIPTLGALAFLLAHWVTTRFDTDADTTGRQGRT